MSFDDHARRYSGSNSARCISQRVSSVITVTLNEATPKRVNAAYALVEEIGFSLARSDEERQVKHVIEVAAISSDLWTTTGISRLATVVLGCIADIEQNAWIYLIIALIRLALFAEDTDLHIKLIDQCVN